MRVMPNTPALVGAGAFAVAAPDAAAEKLETVRALLASIGRVVIVSDSNMDAATAVCGSGPAFIFVVIEALADGGVAAGLPRAAAQELAAQTVLGAAKMVLDTNQHPGQLKDMVTTPAGTTIAGLEILEEAGVRAAFIGAVRAAAQRVSRTLRREIAVGALLRTPSMPFSTCSCWHLRELHSVLLPTFGVHVPRYHPIVRIIEEVADLILGPIRRAIPTTVGGLDSSPMVAIGSQSFWIVQPWLKKGRLVQQKVSLVLQRRPSHSRIAVLVLLLILSVFLAVHRSTTLHAREQIRWGALHRQAGDTYSEMYDLLLAANFPAPKCEASLRPPRRSTS